MDKIQITFDRTKGHAVSKELYGIFFEDINFSCDGGINANMVNNYSFDGVYFSNEEKKAVDDPLRYWITEGITLESGKEAPLHENSRYGHVQAGGHGVLSNLGYNGLKAYRNDCAMNIKKGCQYLFTCYIRIVDFDGTITVQAADGTGTLLTEQCKLESTETGNWQKISCSLDGILSGYGKLQLVFCGSGAVDLDCVSFMDCDYWNKEDPKWRYGKLRKDLVQALADLKPAFLRFPGGCIVEGQLPGNEYNWKDTVGELFERKSNYNLWSEKIADGGYNQSYQIGFYEYFCLCEDLGMKPLPTLTAGLNCQIRSVQRGESECPNIPVDSEQFQTKIVANYMDLLAFAMGDPKENEWAGLRAKMGHPSPFAIDRIGIGNENYGEDYFKRFEIIEKAIHEKYPDMICILCGGLHPFYQDTLLPGLDRTYAFAKNHQNVFVDEHSYHTPEWFAAQSVRFDDYDRNGAGVYFGEYAANSLLAQMEKLLAEAERTGKPLDPEALSGDTEEQGMRPMNESNQLDTALGEAAFLTGLERNSDIVKMSSYAPLLNLVECDQWNHNLINFNPQTLCLTANYYVQKMFASSLGTQYLPYTGELPKDCYISATQDENSVYIKLVNTGAREHLFELQTGSPAAASVEELTGSNAHVRNGLSFYGEADYAIQPETTEAAVKDGSLCIQTKPYSVTVITLKA